MRLMPFSVTVDREHRLIRIALRGAVSDEALLALSAQVRNDPAMAEGFDVLYDCRGATELTVTGDLIRNMGRRARGDKNRVAFVAATPSAFGLARMYQMVAEAEDRIRIFEDEAPAIAWLMGEPQPE